MVSHSTPSSVQANSVAEGHVAGFAESARRLKNRKRACDQKQTKTTKKGFLVVITSKARTLDTQNKNETEKESKLPTFSVSHTLTTRVCYERDSSQPFSRTLSKIMKLREVFGPASVVSEKKTKNIPA